MSETAPALLILDVTADDIRTGERGMPYSCALAKALRRQTGANDVAVTDYDDIVVWFVDEDDEKVAVSYRGPKSITAFLDRFDNFGSQYPTKEYRTDVKPRTFRLKRVSPEPHVPEMR